MAASLLGRPRTTKDVDAVIWLPKEEWEGLVRAARSHDIQPRISDALAFARQSRVLLLRHSPSRIDLDIALGAIPFEEQAIASRKIHRLAGLKVPLPRPEDLIVMKAVAHRPKDTVDIEGLLDAHASLDKRYMIRLVREFADALEAPEIAVDFEELLTRLSK